MGNETTNQNIEFATSKARDVCRGALEVFNELKSGKIETQFAGELSNSLGKANASIGNVLKAESLKHEISKRIAKSEQ